MSLVSELKRRNVFRVGAGYAVLAWVLIQIINTVLPAFGAPAWIVPTLMFIVILGFPIALFLSWAYELTPEGIRPTLPSEEVTEQPRKSFPFFTVLVTVALVYVGVDNYILEDRNKDLSDETTGQQGSLDDRLPNSIALLPFDDSSNDLKNASFTAGIYEGILNQLVKNKSINVITPSALIRDKGDTRSLTDIGKQLNAETIMDGSVRYAEGRVVVNVRLIDARTGVYIWSERYNREYNNLFSIQDDIAMNIATSLKSELHPAVDPIYGLAKRVKGLTALDESKLEEASRSIDRAVNADLQ